MTKLRILLTILTFIVVFTLGTAAFMYARGYRLNLRENSINPTGLLVLKSDPDGAQIFIDNELKSATNTTMSLPPGMYDIRIEKEGYISWIKTLEIKAEIVTEETAHLFKSAPSLTAITFSGVENPTPSQDMSKISYIAPVPIKVATASANLNGYGLWVMEMANLPLGFSREPRRITDGKLNSATWQFSPDDREIILDIAKLSYLLPISETTNEAQRVNITQRKVTTLKLWGETEKTRLESHVNKLPIELKEILLNNASSVVFSPDERMIMYTASASAKLSDNLIKDFPGASTQKQNRDINIYHTYIYDIKEDRNFLIDNDSKNLITKGGITTSAQRRLAFFPTSRNLLLAEPNKITIMDYDGTNRQVVYEGNYVAPFAFPTLSYDRIIILTNLGAEDKIPNLYSVGIK